MSTGPPASAIDSSDPDHWSPGGECRELLQNQRNVVPVVGAGVSQNAGLLGGRDLAQNLTDNFDPHPEVGADFSDPSHLMTVADEFVCNDAVKSEELLSL